MVQPGDSHAINSGEDHLTSWERLVHDLWVVDYCMRNAGDLAQADLLHHGYKLEATRISHTLRLPLSSELFESAEEQLAKQYLAKFEAVCSEIRSVGPVAPLQVRHNQVSNVRRFIRPVDCRFINDEPQPGIAQIDFVDAAGLLWTVIDKTAMFSRSTWTEESGPPDDVGVDCSILTAQDAQQVEVKLAWNCESASGDSIFVLTRDALGERT